MKIQDYLKKLHNSKDFKDFIKENPDAFFCSGFFVRDFEGKQNESKLDYYEPKSKKIITFDLTAKVKKSPMDKTSTDALNKHFVPKEVSNKSNLDIDVVKEVILDEMHNRGKTDDIKKILILYHIKDDKSIWNCTCFLDVLNLLQAHVEDESKTILFMEKKNIGDLIIPLKKGETIKEALKRKEDEKSKFDPEKFEGTNSGFIG